MVCVQSSHTLVRGCGALRSKDYPMRKECEMAVGLFSHLDRHPKKGKCPRSWLGLGRFLEVSFFLILRHTFLE